MIHRRNTEKKDEEKIEENTKPKSSIPIKKPSQTKAIVYVVLIIVFFFLPLLAFFIYFIAASVKVEGHCNTVLRDGDGISIQTFKYQPPSKIKGIFIDEYTYLDVFEIMEFDDVQDVEVETRFKYSSSEYFDRIKIEYEMKDGILHILFDKWRWPNWGCPLAHMLIKLPKKYELDNITVHSQRIFKLDRVNIHNIYITFAESRNAFIELHRIQSKKFFSKFKFGDLRISNSEVEDFKYNGFVGKLKVENLVSKTFDASLDGGFILFENLKSDFVNIKSRKAKISSEYQESLNSIYECQTCDIDIHLKKSSNIKLTQICKNEQGNMNLRLPSDFSGKFKINNPNGDNIFRLITLPMKITGRDDLMESGILGEGDPKNSIEINSIETCQVGIKEE